MAQDRAEAASILRFFDIRYVDVDRALAGPQVVQYVLDVLPVKEIYHDDTRTLYQVDALATPDKINPADETAGLEFDDGWGRAQTAADGSGYRWATRGDSLVWLPLAQTDQTVTFRLLAPGASQAVAVSVNGHRVAELNVTNAWQDYAVRVPSGVLRDGLDEFVFSTGTSALAGTKYGNYGVGGTGVISPVDIAVTGAGYDAGRFGEIFVAGKSVGDSSRGYHLVAINPLTGAVDQVGAFDTFADRGESDRLAQFVTHLPQGEIVAGAAVDDVSTELQQNAVDALHSLGVDGDLRYQFRTGQAFVGVKRAQTGSALEQVNGRFPANVAVGRDVMSDRVAFALGEISIVR
jgi:hypothetical protein